MSFLVDGSNLLGAAKKNRESDDAKRHLVQELARFARARNQSIICFFDGEAPPSFAKSLGKLTVQFSGATSADDRIAARAASNSQRWIVVTSDGGLASRIRSRSVQIQSCHEFLAALENESRASTAANGKGDTEEWEAWFQDAKNRKPF